MCGVWRKNKMVFYAECIITGICRVSASDMEKACSSGWHGVMCYDSSAVGCMAKINVFVPAAFADLTLDCEKSIIGNMNTAGKIEEGSPYGKNNSGWRTGFWKYYKI